MIYSVGCEYVLQALTKLASLGPPGQFILLRELMQGEKLPKHFLGKLFQSLVRDGILLSAKGRGGGFSLRKPPAQTRLRDIVHSIDGNTRLHRCLLGFNTCGRTSGCPNNSPCAALRVHIENMLDRTTLADLLAVYEHRRRDRGRRKGR